MMKINHFLEFVRMSLVCRAVLACLALALAGCTVFHDAPGLARPVQDDHFVVYIAHVNDTHAHLDPVMHTVVLDDQAMTLPVGGYPRLHAQVARWRVEAAQEQAGFLLLHAGDTFQGSGYFMLFQGEPEVMMWNRIGLDAMVLGNHEFDALRTVDIQRDAQGHVLSVAMGKTFPPGQKLAEFIRLANFPVLAANMHVPECSPLFGIPNLAPWVVTEVNGQPVGIFGIVLADMPLIAYPGSELDFWPEAEIAREMVRLLEEQGVDRIIMLSHIGYEQDLEIARSVDGIDVIVGGHTHTVLGDFSDVGLDDGGPYPTMVQSPSGQPTAIVQSGSHAAMAGLLRVVFNAQGEVVLAHGANHLLVLAEPVQEFDTDHHTDRQEHLPEDVLLGQGAVLAWGRENPLDREFIDQQYGRVVREAYGPVIATVLQPLDHERIPTDPAGHGSALAPLNAEALVAGLAEKGMDVDFALVNAGSVRTSIPAGQFRENQALLEVMVFGNRVATFALTGAQVRAVLESVISAALASPQDDGRFPYPARLRYAYDAALPESRRLHDLAVLDKKQGWLPLDEERTYRIAASNYLASGRDGYDLLKRFIDANVSLRIFDALDNQMFVDHVKREAGRNDGILQPLDYSPVTIMNP